MTQEKIRREIANTLDDMQVVGEETREYMIGALAALLWVQSDGDLLRPVAFQQACAAWDTMREGQGQR